MFDYRHGALLFVWMRLGLAAVVGVVVGRCKVMDVVVELRWRADGSVVGDRFRVFGEGTFG